MNRSQQLSKENLIPLDLPTPKDLTLGGSDAELTRRHDAQLVAAPPEYRNREAIAYCFALHNDAPRLRFHLIIALEWRPSVETLAALKSALIEASRLLYDVTDGLMAIGRVLFGDTVVMGCADLQIFASNRLFPRCSVNAMHDPRKYRPMRLGRGLWDKNNRASIAWSTRDGFATLVHELSHHALGLKDQYLDVQANGLVVPQHSLVKDTIMADLSSSELLAPRPNRNSAAADSEWEALRQHPQFASLGIKPNYVRNPRPPTAPLPATIFTMLPSLAQASTELLLVLDPAGVSDGTATLDLGYCWVYVLRLNDAGEPVRLIPQGSFEVRPDGFRLLGAAVGDRVLLCSSRQGSPGVQLNLWSTIGSVAEGVAVLDPWENVTPDPGEWRHVSVKSPSLGPFGPFDVELDDPLGELAVWDAYVCPLGDHTPKRAPKKIDLLDGHILLMARAGRRRLMLASYALGGSPSSTYPAHPNPIPAGSSDGNAMLFFAPTEPPELDYTPTARLDSRSSELEKYLIVTTTNYHASAELLPPQGPEPRSYVFAVASNLELGPLTDYNPTLVLYYDKGSRDSGAETIAIYRYDATGWVELERCEDKPDRFLVAAPLNAKNAPGLYEASPRPEYYRLMLRRAAS